VQVPLLLKKITFAFESYVFALQSTLFRLAGAATGTEVTNKILRQDNNHATKSATLGSDSQTLPALVAGTEKESKVSLTHKFHCEICGAEKHTVNNWFMAEITANGALLSHWRENRAQEPHVHHFCGEAHAQVFVSRYLSEPASFPAPRVLDTKDNDLTAVQSHLVNRVLQQPSEMSAESEEIFDLLAAAEAALKGRITVDLMSNEYFDA
jgi:hypothetical protein